MENPADVLTSKILIVDDSAFVRRFLTTLLGESGDFEVLKPAPSGEIAMQRMAECRADVVVLDVEMPELNGIETLRRLRSSYPDVPVIMFSGHTAEGAAVTVEALSAGAADFVQKPSGLKDMEQAAESLRRELGGKIRALTRPRSEGRRRSPADSGRGTVPYVERNGPIDAIGIAVSTGGPNALDLLFSGLTEPFSQPILIVQHMPKGFTGLLAKRLAARSHLPIFEAAHGMKVEGGSVYIAPGDYHMLVCSSGGSHEIRLNQSAPEHGCRPAADPLFRSLSEVYLKVLGVVLTGMGSDGLAGSRAIRERGGVIIAQDEASSVVWGMPGVVVDAQLAKRTVPIGEMAHCLQSMTERR